MSTMMSLTVWEPIGCGRMNEKILVTGSGGFIGRNMAEKLRDRYRLYCPSSRELDLLDEKAVQAYLEEHSFDVVIHCANRNETRKAITPYDALDGNLRMFFNLERCHGLYGKMLYFGSGAEYDRRHYIPDMGEGYLGTHIPKDAYGFSKYIMAKSCEDSPNIYDLCLFGVYGKYEEWERRFISNAICRGLKGMDITIRQNVYFDYLWVEDLVRMIEWFVREQPCHRRYNVCRGERIDLYTLAGMVREILDLDCRIVVGQPGWKPEYTGSNHRLLKEMGNFAFTPYEETVKALCGYYREHLGEIDETKLV